MPTSAPAPFAETALPGGPGGAQAPKGIDVAEGGDPLRWTHFEEPEERNLDEQMWRILTAETPACRTRASHRVRSGVVVFVCAGLPIASSAAWAAASLLGFGSR